MITKREYEQSKANGTLDLLRGDEISRRIRTKYPLSAQIALLMDKDIKYTEWYEYQAFRQNVKQEVDVELSALEYEITHGA